MMQAGLLKDLKPTPKPPSTAVPFTLANVKSAHSNARLLTRDFIHDSLYNPSYGYFSKRAVIFSPPEEIQFNEIKDATEFSDRIAEIYEEYDDANEEEALQVWHTPTELFKPHYGRAIGNYIWQEWKKTGPESPLVIYEMGAGNGTLMGNIMDFLKENDPVAYDSMEYNIIEISKQLSERQEWNNISHLKRISQQNRRVNIINKSVFEWNKEETRPCFFIALEVIDNFAHDVIRYNLSDAFEHMEPLQTFVVRDKETNEWEEEYEPVNDKLIQRYLKLRAKTGFQSPLLKRSAFERVRAKLPFAPNVTEPEFLPTMLMYFMENLINYFPNHKLVLSDFDELPTPIRGINAPVVQTRLKYRMIPCSTYLVTPGWFDIFFPTDFDLMRKMYCELRGQGAINLKHADFLRKYGDLGKTRTKSGDNPMLDNYKNVQFMLS